MIRDDESRWVTMRMARAAPHDMCTHVEGKWPTTKWRVSATSEHKLHLHLVPYFLSRDSLAKGYADQRV